MKNTPLFYREEAPSAAASHMVLSYWEFAVDDKAPAPLAHEVFPDGCVSIAFYRNRQIPFQKLFINPIHPKSIYVPVRGGDVFWGMRILPEAGRLFFRSDPSTVENVHFDEKFAGDRFSPDLQKRLSDSRDFAEAIAAFEAFVFDHGIKPEEIDRRLARATQIFIDSGGLARISETAKQIGLSERQFERNFRKASGLTPKQFARICRFRATGIDLIKNAERNWAKRAAETGFTDQPHLIREFSRLTGNSPVEFFENLKRIEHGKIID